MIIRVKTPTALLSISGSQFDAHRKVDEEERAVCSSYTLG